MTAEISGETSHRIDPAFTRSGDHIAVLLPVAAIRVVENTRKYIDPDRLADLAADIKKNGLQQPITVVADSDGGYSLVYGERRYRAHRLNGAEVIPAFIRTDLTLEQVRDLRRSENLQHENISPIDEAEDFARALETKSIEALAGHIHHSARYVRDRLALLNLIEKAKAALRTGKIGLDIAKILSCLSADRQLLMLERVEAEGLNARKLANYLAEGDLSLQRAPFDVTECRRCPHNSAGQPDLFEREQSGLGSCLNAPCWRKKEEAAAARVARRIEENGPRAVLTDKMKIDLADLPPDIDQREAVFHQKEEIGEAQLQECASCKFLVAFVSKRGGEILKEKICSMKRCYEEKRREFHQDNKTQQKNQTRSGGSKGRGPKGSKRQSAPSSRSSAGHRMSPMNAPLRVRQFKKQIYRRYLAEQMQKSPQNALLLVLLGMYQAKWIRYWKNDPALKEYGIVVSPPEGDVTAFFQSLRRLTPEALIVQGGSLAVKVLADLPLQLIEEMVFSHLGATPEQIFAVDGTYYELLTKSEIEATAKEMGLDQFLQMKNQSLSKLAGKPKKEFIKGLLAQGFVPERMPAWLQRETHLER